MQVTELRHAASYGRELACLSLAHKASRDFHLLTFRYTWVTGHLGVSLVGAQSVDRESCDV
jgi:hypothetical protein